MTSEEILLYIITLLIAVATYFLKKTFDRIDKIGEDVSDIKPKLDILWKDKIAPASSPRQLNERGESILNESGIRDIVNEKKDELLQLVKQANVSTPYDAEVSIEKVMMDLPQNSPDILDRLKQGAFQSGVDINTALFAGSVYLRNEIFKDLGFDVGELDEGKE